MRGRATKEPPSPSQSGRFLFILINDHVNASFYPSLSTWIFSLHRLSDVSGFQAAGGRRAHRRVAG